MNEIIQLCILVELNSWGTARGKKFHSDELKCGEEDFWSQALKQWEAVAIGQSEKTAKEIGQFWQFWLRNNRPRKIDQRPMLILVKGNKKKNLSRSKNLSKNSVLRFFLFYKQPETVLIP